MADRVTRKFTLLLLASILTPKSDAAVLASADRGVPAKPALNVAVIGDFYSYGYAMSSAATLRQVPATPSAPRVL